MEVTFRPAPPKVFVVGRTMPLEEGLDAYIQARELTWNTDTKDNPATMAEFGGRICYGKSSFANKRSNTQAAYLNTSIIEHKHESVLEHVVVNFAIMGLSRDILQELARHRAGTAFSVRSTRFADDYLEFFVPPLIRHNKELSENFVNMCKMAAIEYVRTADSIDTSGLTGTLKTKRKREAARHILPGALTCDLEFSCNARALRHIIELRSNEHADLSMREFAYELFLAADKVIPELLVGAKMRAIGGAMEVWFGS